MSLNSLPYEIISSCFSYLDTEDLINIILLESIHLKPPLGAEYQEGLEGIKGFGGIEGIEGIESTEAYYETNFDRFLQIHKIFEKKAHKHPLWFHCTWKDFFQMHQNLDEINMAYNGQKLGIHVELENPIFKNYPVFSDHEINLKVTCLSFKAWKFPIDLNNFPKLETFYGDGCEISVDHYHPSLKYLYFYRVTFSSLPTNLIKLEAKSCIIRMCQSHQKLTALKVLTLEHTQRPFDCSSLVRLLWNKNLERFAYYYDRGAIEEDELFSMLGPKLTSLGFCGLISPRIPRLIRSLFSVHGGSFENLIDFSHLSSLTLWVTKENIESCKLPPNLLNLVVDLPRGKIDSLELPLSLLKLTFMNLKFEDLENFNFPPRIVDLALNNCEITLTVGWLKPARLKRLSLWGNELSTLKAVLPCCEALYLKYNSLTDVEIEAPVLEHIDLNENKLTSIPKLPACLQVLLLMNNELDFTQMPDLPSNLKILDLLGAGTGRLRNYTFPSSIQELRLRELDLSGMKRVKFAKGSKLQKLNLSNSNLGKIDDKMIELPLGLKSLNLWGNHIKHMKKLTIPHTVTFLDLELNQLKSLSVKSHIEILRLNQNRLSSLTIPKDLELRALDLKNTGLVQLPLDLFRAEKLTQLRLGREFGVIDVAKMPVNLRILEFPEFHEVDEVEGFRKCPNTNIWRRLP